MGLRTIITAFLLSLVLAIGLTRFLIYAGTRAGIVDMPDGFRKKHKHNVPRIGGLAILLAVTAPTALLMVFFKEIPIAGIIIENSRMIFACFAGAVMVTGLGLMDDIFGLKAVFKLIIQLIIATFMFFAGFKIAAVINPVDGGNVFLGILEFPVTVLWFMVCMNIVNLLDGIDGLAAGSCLFVGVTLFFLSLSFQNSMGMFLMACFVGGILGFLFYNFPPARIFLGDSGSLLLGYLIASLTLLCGIRKADAAVALAIPVVAMGLPILDTTLAVTRRWFRKIPFSSADRMHIHHRLVDGLGYRRALLTLYGVGVLLLLAALLIMFGNNELVLLVLIVLTLVVFACFRFFSGISAADILGRIAGSAEEREGREDSRAMIYRTVAMMKDAVDNDALWKLCMDLFVALKIEKVVLRASGREYVFEKEFYSGEQDDGRWELDLPLRIGDGSPAAIVFSKKIFRKHPLVVDSDMLVILRDGLEKYIAGVPVKKEGKNSV